MWVPIWILVAIALLFVILAAVAVFALIEWWHAEDLLDARRKRPTAFSPWVRR